MIVFATNNAHKLAEVRQILGDSFEVKSLKDIGCDVDIPETADTFEGNAWQKARFVKEHFGYDCMADDSGLEVNALGGEPGVHSARYAATADGHGHDSEANMNLLLNKMQDKTDRSARFRTALALIYNGEEHLFNGVVEGQILTERHGTGGFGYDPIFRPDGYDCSFAEMTAEEKNAISHRGRAIQQLVKFLRLTILIILLLPVTASAQELFTWQTYPSYSVCTKNVPAGNRVYALMESKLMAYDTDDQSITTWSAQTGLSDVSISDIAYCEQAHRIVLVYDNGNIDLLSTDDDADVINLAQLKNSSMQGREVNSITIHGQLLYLSTGFGVVVIDAEQHVILNTYQLGLSVAQCAVTDGYILAATAKGIWRGDRTKNLQDRNNWQQVNPSMNISMMVYYDGYLWVCINGKVHRSKDLGQSFESVMSLTPKYMTVDGDVMIIGHATYMHIYRSADSYIWISNTFPWSDIHAKGKTYWASCGNSGLQAYELQSDKSFTLTAANIHPNSPLHDYAYHLRFAGDKLLVAGGSYNYSSVSLPGTAMILEPDGTWVNFDEASATAIANPPSSHYVDVTDIVQDPADEHHYYVGTGRDGIFEFRDGICTAQHHSTNSPLASILPTNKNPNHFVVANGLTYDNEGNLWMLNPSEGQNDTIIRIMRPNGTWLGLHYSELEDITAMDNITFDSRGWAWINSRRMYGRGIFCLDYNGTVGTRSDDRHILRGAFQNQDGTSYSPDEFYCIVEDTDGSIWIGTNLGPFRVDNPEDFFSNTFTYEQVKVARNDGSGLADYLLNSIPIRSMAIDGAGRKWFGTNSNGVYLVSSDCQEQIYHFTTANSPLPSNDVDAIAIDGTSGRVFFATPRGLCSFVADATSPVDELTDDDQLYVFPNPVYPDYEGPITVRGLAADSEVKILSATGQLIYRGYSNGGTFTWMGTNQRGARVATGIYLVVASMPDGSKAVSTKIAIVR